MREVYRNAISALQVSPDQANQFIAQLVLPVGVGGFVVREVGLLTDEGELYSVANSAAIEKPENGVSVSLQFRLAVSESANIELKVATGDGLFLRIDKTLTEIAEKGAVAQKSSREALGIFDATTTRKGLVQLSSATDSTSETLATTPKAVKAPYDKGDAANKNADGRLAKASNLSDVADKATARANIGLKGAAVLDPQDSPSDRTAGRLLAMGAFGLGEPVAIGTADLNTLTQPGFYCQPQNANAPLSRNYPEAVAGALIVFKSGANGTTGVCQQYMPFNTPRIYYRLNDAATGKWSAWERIFSTADRPTAADVGAISIKGGTATGPVKIKSTDALKIYDDEYGVIFRRSETNLHIIPTPKGAGEDGGIGNLRPFSIDLATGLVRCSNGISASTIAPGDWTNFDNRYQAKGSYTPAGEAWTKEQSNERFIMADAVSYAGFVSNNAAAPYMRHKPSNTLVYLATTSYPYSKGESDARYLSTLQRGSQALVNAAHTTLTVWEAPAGCFMTGINLRADLGDARTMGFYYRSLVMKTVSGGFVQIGN